MRRYFAEFLGTLGLVFFGTGAICINEITGGSIGHLGIALAFGMVVISMIYAFGEISGAHINPAVSIAFWAAGRFSGKELVPYIIAQLLGAIAASLLLYFLFPEASNYGVTRATFGAINSLVLEFILSFFLMLLILHVSTGSKEVGFIAGIAIGLTVGLEALVAGPICGASMNPFRSLGPAIVEGDFHNLWLYFLGPITGMLAATLCYKALRLKELAYS